MFIKLIILKSLAKPYPLKQPRLITVCFFGRKLILKTGSKNSKIWADNTKNSPGFNNTDGILLDNRARIVL